MKTKYLLSLVAVCFYALSINAQMGYQVAVSDPSTGKPKANETVSIEIILSDNAGTALARSSQSVTTNDFGVATVEIGDASTFGNMDWGKLPLWISASVDGVTLGKTQVLTVPVAEHAIHTGTLTPDILAGTWKCASRDKYKFSATGEFTYTFNDSDGPWSKSGQYEIQGNTICMYYHEHDPDKPSGFILTYSPSRNSIIGSGMWGSGEYKK